MAIRRWGILLIFTLSVMLTPATAATAAPGSDDGSELKVLQLNLGGNGFNKGSVGVPVDDLVNRITTEQPDLISLNEMCLTQWLAAADRLGQRPGYATLYTQYAVTNTEVPNCRDPQVDPQGRYVLGVFVRGAGVPVMFGSDPFLELGYDYVATSIPRYRKLVCVDAALPNRPITRFCTTHLEVANIRVTPQTTGDPDIVNDRFYGATMNEAQAAVVAEAVQPWLMTRPVILAGDFNTEPWHPTLDRYYQRCGRGGFTEVDSLNPANADEVESFPAGGWWPATTAACPFRDGQGTVDQGEPREPCENFGDLCQDWKPGDVVPFTGERKIDYIFANPRFFRTGSDSARTIYTRYADHLYLIGRVQLRS